MTILGIETSCDETALALLECNGELPNPRFNVLAEALHSQVNIHKEFGGVFPMMAKREHARNLIPLFKQLLQKAGFDKNDAAHTSKNHSNILKNIGMVLEREPELFKQFSEYIPTIQKPPVDVIAVTQGPGLEPALWVGINFAKALSAFWDIPMLPTNHMEGHLFSVLLNPATSPKDLRFPAVALLISGGHTELILAHDYLSYELIGETRDDAVGEAFDKVARILGLPYPGGPEISKLAQEAREKEYPKTVELPRPMLRSDKLEFSFSGLKTAVLYKTRVLGELSHKQKASIAREFEDAVTDVLVEKTRRALLAHGAKTLIVAGGVSANKHLREAFASLASSLPDIKLLVPELPLSTDNAVMIAMAAYVRLSAGEKAKSTSETQKTIAQGRMGIVPEKA